MPLRLTALMLCLLWLAATLLRRAIVPFPPWAFEVGTIAFSLQFVLYGSGALLEIGSHLLSMFDGVSRLLHRLSLTVFLVGGFALYCLVGDVLGLASMWALYLLCRGLRQRTESAT
jgi:hypothetical protein